MLGARQRQTGSRGTSTTMAGGGEPRGLLVVLFGGLAEVVPWRDVWTGGQRWSAG